jgi:hypothetical protein
MTVEEIGISKIEELSNNQIVLQNLFDIIGSDENVAMPDSCALYKVKIAALWCAYVEIVSCIRLRNSLRKENVGDPV